MGMPKRTYSLPARTLARFEREVPRGQRATVIAALLRSWLDEKRHARMRLEIIEGCRDMADVYLEMEHRFHPLEEDVRHALDSGAAKGRDRAGSSRSRRGIRAGR